jgi:hypothetical protein
MDLDTSADSSYVLDSYNKQIRIIHIKRLSRKFAKLHPITDVTEIVDIDEFSAQHHSVAHRYYLGPVGRLAMFLGDGEAIFGLVDRKPLDKNPIQYWFERLMRVCHPSSLRTQPGAGEDGGNDRTGESSA